jgi:outer membrane protein
MNRIFKSTLIAAVCLMVGLTAQAQKFGYVNSQELINEMPAVKEANAEIETLKSQMQRKGQNMVVALENKFKELQEKEAKGLLSRVQIETESANLQAEQQKIAEFERSSQEQIYKKSEQLLAPIQKQIQDAIDAVAKEKGYNYIFDASLGILLYADESADVTTIVKAKLGM